MTQSFPKNRSVNSTPNCTTHCSHLALQERYVIYYLVLYGLSYREIGRQLNRHHTTITREVKRNGPTYSGGIYWHEARIAGVRSSFLANSMVNGYKIRYHISCIIKGSIMARPLRITYPGAFYHVTSRDNERKDIFKSRRDRKKFLDGRSGHLFQFYIGEKKPDKDLPALKELIDKASLKDIFDEVDHAAEDEGVLNSWDLAIVYD